MVNSWKQVDAYGVFINLFLLFHLAGNSPSKVSENKHSGKYNDCSIILFACLSRFSLFFELGPFTLVTKGNRHSSFLCKTRARKISFDKLKGRWTEPRYVPP